MIILENNISSVNTNNVLKELLMLPEVEMVMTATIFDDHKSQWLATKIPITEHLKAIAKNYIEDTKSIITNIASTTMDNIRIMKGKHHYYFTTMISSEELLVAVTTINVDPYVDHMATLVKLVGRTVISYGMLRM